MICKYLKELESGFRRNEGKWYFWTFYDGINREPLNREPKQLRFSLAIFACLCVARRQARISRLRNYLTVLSSLR
jgi:hypothetical protein